MLVCKHEGAELLGSAGNVKQRNNVVALLDEKPMVNKDFDAQKEMLQLLTLFIARARSKKGRERFRVTPHDKFNEFRRRP